MGSDAELIGRSLAGDGDAFMEVICRHEVAIGAYLERRVGREAAEDLIPDVTGLVNEWDPWPAVDVRVDTRAAFRAALAGLGPQEREVLTLVAGEDLTVADAARVLGMPAGTARRLLHQARAALRNAPEVAALLTELNSVKESQ
jgi:RNA polymerase sigma-70 factor (ECF subfamily)